MKYLKLDNISGNLNKQKQAFMSFVEINDDGYETRKISFYHNSVDLEGYYIGFVDDERQYLGTCLAEYPWQKEDYPTKKAVQKIQIQSECDFIMNSVVEIQEQDFNQIWETIVEQHLIINNNIRLDNEDILIDFNNLPDVFNEAQLEDFAQKYAEDENHMFFDWITEDHMKQVLDYIAKKQG